MLRLREAGYRRYSLYRFLKPGIVPKHQRFFMNEMPNVLGVGVSACSYLKQFAYINYRSIRRYCAAVQQGQLPIEKMSILSKKDMVTLVFTNAVELMHLNKKNFRMKTGIRVHKVFSKEITALEKLRLITDTDSSFKLTDKGILFSQEVWLGPIQDIIAAYVGKRSLKTDILHSPNLPRKK